MADSKGVGFLPLALFTADFLDNWRRGVAADSLWMCHLANLLMGLGLTLKQPHLVRVGLLWSLVGFPLWLREVFLGEPLSLASYASHSGGVMVALWASRSKSKERGWWSAWLLFVVVQQGCRLYTPVAQNVNVAHSMWDGGELVFSSYWHYWLVTTLMVGLTLFLVDALVGRFQVEGNPA